MDKGKIYKIVCPHCQKEQHVCKSMLQSAKIDAGIVTCLYCGEIIELEKAPTAYDVDKVVDRINIIFKHHRATKTVQRLVVETIEAGVSN